MVLFHVALLSCQNRTWPSPAIPGVARSLPKARPGQKGEIHAQFFHRAFLQDGCKTLHIAAFGVK